MKKAKWGVVIAVVAVVAAFFAFDLGRYFSLEFLKSQQAAIDAIYRAHPARTVALFVLTYFVVTSLSLPGAAIMTLAGGAIFGFWVGTASVIVGATLGATAAFLIARFLLHDWVQARFRSNLLAINEGVRRDGAFYLFTLRLIPAFPFFVVNGVMALTPIRVLTYAWVSMVGMLPGTMVYVNAGTELAKIDSLRGILSPTLILSFTLLGVFPLIAKKFVAWIKARRA